MAYVEDALDDEDRTLIEAYLKRSEAGRQEVALLRQGRMLVNAVDRGEITIMPQTSMPQPPKRVPDQPSTTQTTPSTRRTVWLAAVAAALVATVAASLVWWQAYGPTAPQTTGRIADGQLNVPIVEMLPADGVLRGEEIPTPTVTLAEGNNRVVLILVSEQDLGSSRLAIEASDQAGTVFWTAQGLERDPRGEYTLSLRIPSRVEHVTLEIFALEWDQRRQIEQYQLAIDRQPENSR